MSQQTPFSNPSQAPLWRQQLAPLLQQMHSWWHARSDQERKLLRLCAVIVAAALIWVLGLQPALRTIEQSRVQLPLLHADAAQVQAYILEAQALRRQHTGRIDAADLTQALNTSLERAGLQDVMTVDEVLSDNSISTRQWEITAQNGSATRVMAWLADLPYLLRLQISMVELERANVQGRDRPGHVSGRIVLSQAAKDQP